MDWPCSHEAERDGVPVAPPPVVHEPVPGYRAAHVWIPGYWGWADNRHVWIAGRWMPARHGCHWRRHRWIRREDRWYLEPGGWIVDESATAEKRPRVERETLR
jgi:hypothetical protein